jgi:hypothetical protein
MTLIKLIMKNMKQTEIFPILEDQKLIDDYISYQNALISWKNL